MKHRCLLVFQTNSAVSDLSCLKGTVHPKMKILSSLTHPQVDPNLYECVCSAEHKGRYSEEWGKQSSSGAPLTSIVFPSMEVNGAPKQPGYKLSSKYLPLCSEQTHSYRFGSTWGWVNDDRIFIFGWTVPLRLIWMWLVLVWTEFISGGQDDSVCFWLTSMCSASQPSSLAMRDAIRRAKHFFPSSEFPPYPLPNDTMLLWSGMWAMSVRSGLHGQLLTSGSKHRTWGSVCRH